MALDVVIVRETYQSANYGQDAILFWFRPFDVRQFGLKAAPCTQHFVFRRAAHYAARSHLLRWPIPVAATAGASSISACQPISVAITQSSCIPAGAP